MKKDGKSEIYSPLTAKLLRTVFSIYFLIALLVTGVHLYIDFRTTQKDIYHNLGITQRAYEKGIIRALWYLDDDYLKAEIKGLLTIPEIIGIKIIDDKSKIYFAGLINNRDGIEAHSLALSVDDSDYQKAITNHGPLLEHQFPLIYIAEDGERYELGIASFYSKSSIVWDRLRPKIILITVTALIKTAALGFIILIIGQRILGRPLRRMAETAARINLDNLDECALEAGIEKSDKNELTILRDAYNKMIRDLHQSRVALDEIHRNMENLVADRTTEWEKANENLQQEIKERQLAEKQIAEALNEKETLLKEIHHRVKNNMNVISSLLMLHINSTENEEIQKALSESRDRVYAMSAVHETLYSTQNLSEIDLNTYLRKLSESLVQTYSVNPDKARLIIEGDRIKVNIDKASPLGLSISELVSNSIKYAFPEEQTGLIEIMTRKNENQVSITVSDNGLGLPESFDWRSTNSLGLKLVRNLVERQLNGSIHYENKNGTRFTILIELNSE